MLNSSFVFKYLRVYFRRGHVINLSLNPTFGMAELFHRIEPDSSSKGFTSSVTQRVKCKKFHIRINILVQHIIRNMYKQQFNICYIEETLEVY